MKDLEGIEEDFIKLLDVKAITKVGIFTPSLARKEEALNMISTAIQKQKIRVDDEKYLIFFITYLGSQVDPENNCEVSSFLIDKNGFVEKLHVSYTSAID